MLSRRAFVSLAAASVTAPRLSSAQPAPHMIALYANVGADLDGAMLSAEQQEDREILEAVLPECEHLGESRP
jgi:hypothetical protein